MNRISYIYVLEDEPNICKIGYSYEPSDIIKIADRIYHRTFKIRGLFETQDPRGDEKLIHDLLKFYRIKGEWFNLSYEDIKKAVLDEFGAHFVDYVAKEAKKNTYKITAYLPKDCYQLLNKMCAKNMREHGRQDKSSLIAKAIERLYETV